MVLNIHPIFVHFPIALLTIYGILELVWSKRLRQNKSFFIVKLSFVILGVLGAFAALQTGDIAEEAFRGSDLRHLISVHSTWAGATTVIFGVLALAYLVLAYRNFSRKLPKNNLVNLLIEVAHIIAETPLVYLLALAGIIAISVTGALGGAIVYGPDVDPIVSLIYHLIMG